MFELCGTPVKWFKGTKRKIFGILRQANCLLIDKYKPDMFQEKLKNRLCHM